MKEYEMKCYPGNDPRILITKEFVSRNNFKIDTEEALKIMEDDQDDIFGFKSDVALQVLTKEQMLPFFSEEALEEDKNGKLEWSVISDIYEFSQDFLDYMVFAWMKADDERGISASRSIQKLSAYMTILGRPDISRILEDTNLYNPYGKPALIKTCEILGISYPDYLKAE